MTNPLTRIKEAIVGKRGSVAFPEGNKQEQVYPEPDFQSMTQLLLGDSDVAAAIEFIAYVATGNGFETTMSAQYKELSKGKTAKEVVDQKCKDFGFDELTQEMAQDIIGFGNCFISKGNSVKFLTCSRVLPYYIQKVVFEKQELSKLHIQTLTNSYDIDGAELVWLSNNHVGVNYLGVGVLQSLLTSYQGRPCFAKIKAQVEKAMADQIENFSAYSEIWVFNGVPDKDVSAYNTKVQALKKGGRITTNKPASVERSIPERMRGLDFYAETLWDSFYLALKTPYPKLVLGGSFTEASANAAIAIGEFRTAALRRYLKRVIETQFFDKWVDEAGLDSAQAQVRLNWRLLRMPDMSVLMSVLTKLVELGSLKTQEIRHILIDMGLPLVSEEVVPEVPSTAATTEVKPTPDQPQLSAEKKHEVTPRGY